LPRRGRLGSKGAGTPFGRWGLGSAEGSPMARKGSMPYPRHRQRDATGERSVSLAKIGVVLPRTSCGQRKRIVCAGFSTTAKVTGSSSPPAPWLAAYLDPGLSHEVRRGQPDAFTSPEPNIMREHQPDAIASVTIRLLNERAEVPALRHMLYGPDDAPILITDRFPAVEVEVVMCHFAMLAVKDCYGFWVVAIVRHVVLLLCLAGVIPNHATGQTLSSRRVTGTETVGFARTPGAVLQSLCFAALDP
jgi:hypothetical protein